MAILHSARAQNVVYNHFYDNPYVFNPAEVGTSGYTSVSLNHRSQWTGIEGAPKISTLTFQTPFSYKRAAIGAYINTFDRGLFTTTDAWGTFGYTSYLTKTTTMHFGISAGITSTSLDLNEIDDPNDPILGDFLNNNMQVIGNVGFKLQAGSGLNFGISLPQLLQKNLLNSQDFSSYRFSPLDEVNIMLYYRKRFDKKIVNKKRRGVRGRVSVEDYYAPLQLYLFYKYSGLVDDRIEFLATLNLGEHLWVGGAFRINYGPTGLFGIKGKSFRLGYAYEPANDFVSGFTNGTHELQLQINIGKKKKLERSKPILRTINKQKSHEARFTQGTLNGGSPSSDAPKGKVFYVVLKAFNNFNSADDLVRRLSEQDIETDIFYNKNNRRFYVYIYKTTKAKEANQEKKAVQELTKFKSVSVIVVDE